MNLRISVLLLLAFFISMTQCLNLDHHHLHHFRSRQNRDSSSADSLEHYAEESSSEYSFKPELLNPKRSQTINNGKTLKSIGYYDDTFALIFPAISQAKVKNIQLKPTGPVTDDDDLFYVLRFGAARLKIMKQEEFNWTGQNEGLFLTRPDGRIINKLNADEEKSKSLNFKAGDIVGAQYDSEKKELTLKNISEGKTVVLTNIHDDNKDLHFCVYVETAGQTWDIV